jgi:hypothetical protein
METRTPTKYRVPRRPLTHHRKSEVVLQPQCPGVRRMLVNQVKSKARDSSRSNLTGSSTAFSIQILGKKPPIPTLRSRDVLPIYNYQTYIMDEEELKTVTRQPVYSQSIDTNTE